MALIDLIASVPADNTALVRPESDFRLKYGALRTQVEILAGALADAGVRQSDRVAVALPNEPALVVAILAASPIGAAVPLDDRKARASAERYVPGAERNVPSAKAHSTQHQAPCVRSDRGLG
jgi:acyl-coenzyme A synthetase/AMP-(fatty) acid ligase